MTLIRREDSYLYHATRYQTLASIQRQGLRPEQDCLYFTEPEGLTFWLPWATGEEGDVGGVPVVLRVPRDQVGSLIQDYCGTKDAEASAYITERPVPARAIEVWTGSAWVSLARHEEVEVANFWGLIAEGHLVEDTDLMPPEGWR